ncbi:hypothetical protein JCM6882_005438 [Rhodosporidiobolus microsporus]
MAQQLASTAPPPSLPPSTPLHRTSSRELRACSALVLEGWNEELATRARPQRIQDEKKRNLPSHSQDGTGSTGRARAFAMCSFVCAGKGEAADGETETAKREM